MITHHHIYNKVYKKLWIALMILFCWVVSFGMQMPTLFGVWGKVETFRLRDPFEHLMGASSVSIY